MALPDTTITITDIRDLQGAYQALSTNGGGTIAIAAQAKPIAISLTGGGDAAVRIVPADADAPTLLHQISIQGAANVTVSGFEVDSTGVVRPEWHSDLMISNSSGIVIENTTFTSDAVGRFPDDDAGAKLGENFGSIRNSTDVEFRGNTVSNYYQGLSVMESKEVTISDNEFTRMQGDGIRLAGVQDVDVTDNHLHNFLGTLNSFNHNDFIQVWSTNTVLLTTNLKISGNVIDAGEGSSAQGIFIGNERARFGEDHRYQNIEISDNLLHIGNPRGILVGSADGVVVRDNTLLWNSLSGTVQKSGDDVVSRAPQISLYSIEGGAVTGNIAPGITASGMDISDNAIVTYGSPSEPGYVGNHFINAAHGGTLGEHDVRLLADSAWNGKYGHAGTDSLVVSQDGIATIFTVSNDPSDLYLYTLDASHSVNEAGLLGEDHLVRWTLTDGTVLEGMTVDHMFTDEGPQGITLEIFRDGALLGRGSREIKVESKTLLSLDFGETVTDMSTYGTGLGVDTANLGPDGYRIGGDQSLTVNRGAGQVHELSSFGIEMEMNVSDTDGGRFLHLYRAMEARVRGDGQVEFTLQTDAGKFVVRSGDAKVGTGTDHKIAVHYDGGAGRLTLLLDDVVVGETAASGTTPAFSHHGLIIGSAAWQSSLEATVSAFRMTSDPAALAPRQPAAAVEEAPAVEMPVSEAALPVVDDGFLAPGEVGPSMIDVDFEWVGDVNDGMSMKGFSGAALTGGNGDLGYQIAKGQTLSLGRWVDDQHEMGAFSLEMDVTADPDDLTGMLVHFYKVLDVSMDAAGMLRFRLETDEGKFAVAADGSALRDGGTHRLGISYDGDAGTMALQIDGVTLAKGGASGSTAEKTYYGLTIGHTWAKSSHDTFDAIVDDIVFSARGAAEGPPAALADGATDGPLGDPVLAYDDQVF